MKKISFLYLFVFAFFCSCNKSTTEHIKSESKDMSAAEIFNSSDYLAISYGGYRAESRDVQPTIAELKEDMKILAAMDVRILRTYNVHLDQAANVLKAITELKKEDPQFEMYVMLGAWIDCKNAWNPGKENHEEESERNQVEIETAVSLAQQYPSIVKVIAVGNEAMVHWAASYFVRPKTILKWVNHLQNLKHTGALSNDVWITSSDNFASWGGGDAIYHTPDLNKLIKAVDYISMHTYPMHETHYNHQFWIQRNDEVNKSNTEIIDAAMSRSLSYAQTQYQAVKNYMLSLGVDKPIHIGETGWASTSDEFYGSEGSKACDEYKQGLYFKQMRAWTKSQNIQCFFFEAFDEKWKDSKHPNGSENHFGLINLKGEAKFAIWDLVDQGIFDGLQRGGKTITKTFNGDHSKLMQQVLTPPTEYVRTQ